MELGKPYWGTVGRYMHKNMIRAFVEEIGHQFTIGWEERKGVEDVDAAALAAAAEAIEQITRKRIEDEDENIEEEDAEEEDGEE